MPQTKTPTEAPPRLENLRVTVTLTARSAAGLAAAARGAYGVVRS